VSVAVGTVEPRQVMWSCDLRIFGHRERRRQIRSRWSMFVLCRC